MSQLRKAQRYRQIISIIATLIGEDFHHSFLRDDGFDIVKSSTGKRALRLLEEDVFHIVQLTQTFRTTPAPPFADN